MVTVDFSLDEFKKACEFIGGEVHKHWKHITCSIPLHNNLKLQLNADSKNIVDGMIYSSEIKPLPLRIDLSHLLAESIEYSEDNGVKSLVIYGYEKGERIWITKEPKGETIAADVIIGVGETF